MIYNRTQESVDKARAALNKILSSRDFTEAELSYCNNMLYANSFNVETINRVKNQQKYLKKMLATMYYFSEDISTEEWNMGDYFRQSDFDKILADCDVLKEAFYLHESTPDIPDNNFFRWRTINALEYLLHDFDLMISDMKSYYRECGDCECGEE